MKPNILVVDDDQELRKNICEILADAGFSVTLAAHGEEALARLGEMSFDLVLLDLVMPGLGGKEVLSLIKRQFPRVRVIMITAYATVEDAVAAMKKGADDFLAKPFKLDDLLTVVRRNLEEARLQHGISVIDAEKTFSTLANTTRREVLFLIAREGRIRFMDIARNLEIEDHTKMNFHLKILREAGFIEQDGKKFYVLTREGRRTVDCVGSLFKSSTT